MLNLQVVEEEAECVVALLRQRVLLLQGWQGVRADSGRSRPGENLALRMLWKLLLRWAAGLIECTMFLYIAPAHPVRLMLDS